eukprot:TRINITY_DN7794_c0_g2_i1.p1 TRINITY_DN7794_c0_g2~~TRINITY_DN7794_c0_g2_i1.p1  ORF type:complete len:159 (-),score=20.57 TRINITY_DN7794_c0_g2_i1:49-525(-)
MLQLLALPDTPTLAAVLSNVAMRCPSLTIRQQTLEFVLAYQRKAKVNPVRSLMNLAETAFLRAEVEPAQSAEHSERSIVLLKQALQCRCSPEDKGNIYLNFAEVIKAQTKGPLPLEYFFCLILGVQAFNASPASVYGEDKLEAIRIVQDWAASLLRLT